MKKLRTRSKFGIGFLSLILILVAARLYLPVWAKRYLNQQLNQDPLYRGSIGGVNIHLWRGAYTIIDLKIERVEEKHYYPLVSAARVDIGLAWRELFHRSFVAKIEAKDLVGNIVIEPEQNKVTGNKKTNIGGDTKKERKAEADNWHTVFKNLVPLNVSSLAILGTSIHFRDETKKPRFDIYLDELFIEGHNLTNSRKVSKKLFGTVKLKARAMKSGKLDMTLLIDPIVSPSEFKLIMKLSDLELRELNPFFTAYGKFDVKKGSIDIYAEAASANDKVIGYAKPVINNLEVTEFAKDKEKGVWHVVWEEIVGAIGVIFKNHPKDRQAARIPFSGKLSAPDIDVGAAFMSVLQNMFVKPITANEDKSIKLEDVKKGKNP